MPTVEVTTVKTLIPGLAAGGDYALQCHGDVPIHIVESASQPSDDAEADFDVPCDSLRRTITHHSVAGGMNVYAWVGSGTSVLAWEAG